MLERKISNILVALIVFSGFLFAQTAPRDFSKETARPTADWVKDAVIYQIFERQYSQKGDFNWITADLDRIKNLGVDVLWLTLIRSSRTRSGSPKQKRRIY